MTSVFLSCYNLPIIKQVAWILGEVMNLLYIFFGKFGIYNIGLCIIVFTILIKMVLLPMTIKQQKFTRLSAVMNPEIQAVQKKYKDKRDQDSVMKMNKELSTIYEKYGTSPTGGCLTLLVQMPIILALYGVISQVPTFIPEVGDMFKNVGNEVVVSVEYFDELNKLDELLNDSDDSELDKLAEHYEYTKNDTIDKEATADKIYESFTSVQTAASELWNTVFTSYDEADEIIDKLSNLSEDEWNKLLAANEKNEDLIKKYMDKSSDDWSSIKNSIDDNKKDVEGEQKEVKSVYNFFNIDLSLSPSVGAWYALLIPLLAALTQFLSVKVASKSNGQMNADNPMGSSMKMMNYTMPVMSAVFCYTLPAGLGLYWVMSAVVQVGQTLAISSYFKNMDVNDIIKENVKKINKKREKQGLPPQKITTAATTSVKNIKVEESKPVEVSKPNNSSTANKGSIASKANLVSKYNSKK